MRDGSGRPNAPFPATPPQIVGDRRQAYVRPMAAPAIHRISCSRAHGRDGCSQCKVRLLSVCAALDPTELSELEALAQPMTYAARATIFTVEEPADYLFNVTSGALRFYNILPDGRRQIVGFALPGDFVGLGLAEVHGFSADTIGETELCRFSRRAFTELVERKPHLLRRMLELATYELNIAQDHMMLLGRQTAEERVVSFLLRMSDRWARILGPSATVPLPMGRQDIADFLGLTIETVSRTLTALERDGMILIVPDGVRLLKPQSLGRVAAA
jgi:CRP/FNR family transcriptional regulator